MYLLMPIFRLILCGTFAAAGWAKIRDRMGTAATLTAFGVPKNLLRFGAIALPVCELLTAASLIAVATSRAGAVAAFVLLLLFVAVICYNLARDRRPACNCFGQISAKPIGPGTVVRNLLLAGCAATLMARGPGPGFPEWLRALAGQMNATTVALAAGVIVLLIQAGLLVMVLQQQGRILQRLNAMDRQSGEADTAKTAPEGHGLRIGTRAPDFSLQSLAGETVSLGSLRKSGDPLLLLFMNPHCGPCVAMAQEAADWMSAEPAGLKVAMISEGTAEENLAKSEGMDRKQILLQAEREVADAFHAWGTPAALIVAADGTIASNVAQGAEAIRALVAGAGTKSFQSAGADRTAGAAEVRNGPLEPPVRAEVGMPVPSLELQLLSGEETYLDDFRKRFADRALLLLFWNPTCGFCQQMLEDLRAWELRAASETPALLVLSTGGDEENRLLRLRSEIAWDQGSRAASAFGAGGTPMAVLIDSAGRIASEVVGGAEAVFSLARRTTA